MASRSRPRYRRFCIAIRAPSRDGAGGGNLPVEGDLGSQAGDLVAGLGLDVGEDGIGALFNIISDVVTIFQCIWGHAQEESRAAG